MSVHLPEGVFLIRYADDVALSITDSDLQMIQERLTLVMRQINLWMGEHGLQLAIPKTKIILSTRRMVSTDTNVYDNGNAHTNQTNT